MVKIHVILAMPNQQICTLDTIKPYEKEGIQLELSYASTGPESVRNEFDFALVVPGVLRAAIDAEERGADAVVIDCMGDPGLRACKELLSIPVVGSAEPAFHVACTLSDKFSIITTGSSVHAMLQNLALIYGVDRKLASIRTIEIDPKANYYDEKVIDLLVQEMINVIEADHAGCVIWGSGRLVGFKSAVLEKLRTKKNLQIPIIEPLPTAIYFAKMLLDAALVQSPIPFSTPPKKTIHGYEIF